MLAGLVGDDVIFLDVAVIEQPLGDAFVNHDLWAEADEQIIRADGGEQAISWSGRRPWKRTASASARSAANCRRPSC